MSRSNRDHAKKKHRPMVEDEAIASQLKALLTPAITSQENYYRQLGLRDRILNLPLMVAAVLTLLWRDVAGVTELTGLKQKSSPNIAKTGFIRSKQVTIEGQLFKKSERHSGSKGFQGFSKSVQRKICPPSS